MHPVLTLEFQKSLGKVCDVHNDDWSQKVISHIAHAQDLCAAAAMYHNKCSVNFRTGKQIPQEYIPAKKSKSGRPEDEVRCAAFMKVAECLE